MFYTLVCLQFTKNPESQFLWSVNVSPYSAVKMENLSGTKLKTTVLNCLFIDHNPKRPLFTRKFSFLIRSTLH